MKEIPRMILEYNCTNVCRPQWIKSFLDMSLRYFWDSARYCTTLCRSAWGNWPHLLILASFQRLQVNLSVFIIRCLPLLIKVTIWHFWKLLYLLNSWVVILLHARVLIYLHFHTFVVFPKYFSLYQCCNMQYRTTLKW